ncbi:MAG: translocation/assembly module TamB domain-containing protein [Planctomycetota bacterium]|jgi:autotransporter translocation and assembly factor TamB
MRRLRKWLAVLLLVVVAVYLLRGPLLSGPVARFAERQAAEALGGTVTIGRLEGNWVTEAVLHDVTVEIDGLQATVERLTVRYGAFGIGGLELVEATGSDAVVDVRGPGGESSGPPDFSWVDDLPALRADGRATIRTDHGDLPVTGISVAAQPGSLTAGATVGGGGIAATVESGRIAATLGGVDLRPFMTGVAEGSVSYDGVLRGTLSLRNARYDQYRADTASVTFDGPRITHLDLRAGSSHVHGGDILIDLERPYGFASIGSLTIDVRDLRDYNLRVQRAVSLLAEVKGDEQGRILVDRALLKDGASTARLSGTVALHPDTREWDRMGLELEGSAELVDFGRPLDLKGRLEARGSVRGTLRSPQVAFKADGEEFTLRGRDVKTLSMDAEYEWPTLVLHGLSIDAAPGRLTAKGRVDLERERVLDGTYDIDIGDLDDFLGLFPDTPLVSGALKGKGRFFYEPDGLNGSGSLEARGLVWNETAIGDVTIAAEADADVIFLTQVDGRGPWGWVKTKGSIPIGKRALTLDRFEGVYGRFDVKQETPALLRWGRGLVAVEGIDAEALGGRIRGRVDWDAEPDADLVAESIELSRLHDDFTGFMTATIKAKDATYEIDVFVPELFFGTESGEVRFQARQGASGGIRIDSLDVAAGTLVQAHGEAVLPWRFEDGGFERVPGGPQMVKLDATLKDFFDLPAEEIQLGIAGNATSLAVRCRARDLAIGSGRVPGLTRFDLTATRDGATLRVSGPPESEHRVAGSLTSGGLDWTEPADWRRAFDEATLDGEIDLTIPDLGPLAALVPEVRYLGGRATVKADVAGPWRRPLLTGQAEFEGVECSIPGLLPTIRRGNGRVRFNKGTVTIDRLGGELGHAPFAVTGTLRDGNFDVKLKGRNVLLMRRAFLRLRADVDLSLKGPLHALVAAGRVKVTDAVYTEPISLFASSAPAADNRIHLFSIREPPFAQMRFDIDLAADRSFRVANNVLRADLSADLRLTGTGELPVALGRIAFPGALVRWDFSTLKVEQGSLRFRKENPDGPTLEAVAVTRQHGYLVSVMARGELPDVRLIVSSTPSLTQEEALLLIATGATPKAVEVAGAQNIAAVRAAAFLGHRLVERVEGPYDPDSPGFLDRFGFEIGRELSKNRLETIEGEFRVSDMFYLRGERDRWEDYNGGLVWRLRFK